MIIKKGKNVIVSVSFTLIDTMFQLYGNTDRGNVLNHNYEN